MAIDLTIPPDIAAQAKAFYAAQTVPLPPNPHRGGATGGGGASAIAVRVGFSGNWALEQLFKTFADKVRKRIIRKALRRAAERMRDYIVFAVSGQHLQQRTGTYARAWMGAKMTGVSIHEDRVWVGLRFPTREEIGIAPDDAYFYPAAIEYGHAGGGRGTYRFLDAASGRRRYKRVSKTAAKDVRPYPHVRPAVDEHAAAEANTIIAEIKGEIEKEAARMKDREMSAAVDFAKMAAE